jgi:N-acetylglutamate synthase-like GNAT family acetyltransferase
VTKVVVRRYRPDDLEACRALWRELTQWHRRVYEDETIGGEDPGLHFDAHLEDAGAERIWVAEADGRVVGFAGLLLSGRRAEIEPVSVAEHYRGRGVGRALVEAVLEEARAQGLGQVRVRPTGRNAEAIRFFHALGFDVLSRLELVFDLTDDPRWRAGERIAGREFRV